MQLTDQFHNRHRHGRNVQNDRQVGAERTVECRSNWASPPSVRLLRAVPQPQGDFGDGVEATLSQFVARAPHSWDIGVIDTDAHLEKCPNARLDRLVAAHPGCLWILPCPPKNLIAWAEKSAAPTIALGAGEAGQCPMSIGLEPPSATFADAVGRFLAAGYHRIVCAPDPSDFNPQKHENFWHSAQVEFERSKLTRWIDEFFSLYILGDGGEFTDVLEQEFELAIPCGVVCESIDQYLQLVAFCGRKGLRLPGMVSAIVLDAVAGHVLTK